MKGSGIMTIKKDIIKRGGRKLIITSQYDEHGRVLRILGKSIPEVPEKKDRKEVTSPFLKIWEK